MPEQAKDIRDRHHVLEIFGSHRAAGTAPASLTPTTGKKKATKLVAKVTTKAAPLLAVRRGSQTVASPVDAILLLWDT
jgi:hypothetical protein